MTVRKHHVDTPAVPVRALRAVPLITPPANPIPHETAAPARAVGAIMDTVHPRIVTVREHNQLRHPLERRHRDVHHLIIGGVTAPTRTVRVQQRIGGAEVPAQLRGAHEYLLAADVRSQPTQSGVALAVGTSARVFVRETGVCPAGCGVVPVLRIHHPCLCQLAHVRGAGGLARCLPCAEEDGKQQRHQHRQNGDDHQQLHQREAFVFHRKDLLSF